MRKAALAFLAALLVASCGPNAPQTPLPQSELHRGNGAEPESLDPALADTTWENNIIGDMMMGLFTEDAGGKAIFGAAEDARVSPDGLRWVFTLRDHLWSDGTKVTADDFVYAWRRTLDPKTGSKYGSILYAFKNAKAVAEGKLPPDALGVHAADARTLVLDLEHPAPYMRELLNHNITYPVPRHVVEAKGAAWTQAGNYISNGAYVLAERVPGDHITLAKNPKFYDAAHVRIDRVVFYPTEDSSSALKRLRGGELDTQEPFPADQIDWLRTNMPETLRQTPTLAIDYIVLNMRRKPFGDVRVREALDLALDRETIAEKIYRIGEVPAYNIVPPGAANYPGGATLAFKATPYAARVAKAQKLMRQAGYGPNHLLHAAFSTPSLPDSRRAAVAIQSMWRAVYVDLQIAASDSAVHYAKIRQYDFDIASASWGADFNDASNFLMLLATGTVQNYAGYSNPAYDALYARAEAEPDVERRGANLLAAERIALDDHAWIVRNFRSTRTVVQPYVKGWIANARDVNRTRFLWVEK